MSSVLHDHSMKQLREIQFFLPCIIFNFSGVFVAKVHTKPHTNNSAKARMTACKVRTPSATSIGSTRVSSAGSGAGFAIPVSEAKGTIKCILW